MINKPAIFNPGIYFITFTHYNWLPLIETTNTYSAYYNWFEHLHRKGHAVTGYIVMPNHLHLLLHYKDTHQSLNKIIGNGKRFIAYEIIAKLQQAEHFAMLNALAAGVRPSDRKRNKLHQVFEPSFDAKLCGSISFFMQKLAYLHNNPLQEKWKLCLTPADYLHSSAGYYETGIQGLFPVIHYNDLGLQLWHGRLNDASFRSMSGE